MNTNEIGLISNIWSMAYAVTRYLPAGGGAGEILSAVRERASVSGDFAFYQVAFREMWARLFDSAPD